MDKHPKNPALAMLVDWLWVGLPLAWGISETVLKARVLFR
jgi:hypothetical protein